MSSLLITPRFRRPFPLIVRPPDDYASEGGAWGAARAKWSTEHKRSVYYPHPGTDLWCAPGTQVAAPWDVKILKVGYPYGNDLSFRYVSIQPLDWVDQEDGYWRLFYVAPEDGLEPGLELSKAAPLGVVQDLGRRYPRDAQHPAGILTHVHAELWKRQRDGEVRRIDPWPALELLQETV